MPSNNKVEEEGMVVKAEAAEVAVAVATRTLQPRVPVPHRLPISRVPSQLHSIIHLEACLPSHHLPVFHLASNFHDTVLEFLMSLLLFPMNVSNNNPSTTPGRRRTTRTHHHQQQKQQQAGQRTTTSTLAGAGASF